MNLQYITDNKGITTGVFIPIEEWNEIKESYKISEDDFQLSKEQIKELDWRIDQHLNNPHDLLDWEEVRKRLIANKI